MKRNICACQIKGPSKVSIFPGRGVSCVAAGLVTRDPDLSLKTFRELDRVCLRNGSQKLVLVSRRFAGISVTISNWLNF